MPSESQNLDASRCSMSGSTSFLFIHIPKLPDLQQKHRDPTMQVYVTKKASIHSIQTDDGNQYLFPIPAILYNLFTIRGSRI